MNNFARALGGLMMIAPVSFGSLLSSYTQVCSQTNPTVETCSTNEGAGAQQSSISQGVGPGTFNGTARTTSGQYSVGVATSVTVDDYPVTANIFFDEAEANNTARAEAVLRDTLRLSGILPSTFSLQLQYSLDGSFFSNSPWITSRLYDDTALFPSPLTNGSPAYPGSTPVTYRQTSVVPASVTRTFTGLSGNEFVLFFSFLATTDIARLTEAQAALYSGVLIDGSGSAQFGSTATITSLLVTDSNGNPVQGISITGEDGTFYPGSSPAAVPEPSAFWLMGGGLAVAFGRGLAKRRARAR